MINQANLSFGQKIDESNGLIMPWFTHGLLDEVSKMDLSDKNILMFGSGMGDRWLAARCKSLYCVERNQEWYEKGLVEVGNHSVNNLHYIFRPCNEGSGMQDYYTEVPSGIMFDVVIVDDAYRYECILKALEMPRPLTLIVDNFMQDYVFICPAAVEALKDFDGKYFIQPDHKDHEGNPWKTAIWQLK